MIVMGYGRAGTGLCRVVSAKELHSQYGTFLLWISPVKTGFVLLAPLSFEHLLGQVSGAMSEYKKTASNAMFFSELRSSQVTIILLLFIV